MRLVSAHPPCRPGHDRNSFFVNGEKLKQITFRNGKQIYLDVEFFITSKCNSNSEKENSKCKETFNIFYYQADGPVASSTFPPWRENPYVKIDTVAANNAEDLNSKTFTFGSLTRSVYEHEF